MRIEDEENQNCRETEKHQSFKQVSQQQRKQRDLKKKIKRRKKKKCLQHNNVQVFFKKINL
jgi:hypothetical protein